MKLIAVYKINAREGAHNRIVVEYHDGCAEIRRFCETKYDDDFVMKEIRERHEVDMTEPIGFLKKHMKKSVGNDYELTVDGKTISGDYAEIPKYLLEFQNMIGSDLGFSPQSENMRYDGISEKKLKELLSRGMITKKKYDEIAEIKEKGRKTAEMIGNKTYPFSKKAVEMIEDCDSGNLSRELFDCFVWCTRNVKPEKSDIVRIKLRLSLWGQRLLGRYDTCEYVIESGEVYERRYSVHGTLFEGCGNYKAPESANVYNIGKTTSEHLMSFIQGLKNGGYLGKDYSTPGTDCSFFDLYIKSADGTHSHTKGTSEYPHFVKFIMYLIDAKDLV